MATITITIPDDKAAEVLDSFAERFGYNQNSGLTKAEFAKEKIIEYLKRQYVEYMVHLRAEEIKSDLDGIT